MGVVSLCMLKEAVCVYMHQREFQNNYNQYNMKDNERESNLKASDILLLIIK